MTLGLHAEDATVVAMGAYAGDPRIGEITADSIDLASGQSLIRISDKHVWRLYDLDGTMRTEWWLTIHGALAFLLGPPAVALAALTPDDPQLPTEQDAQQ